MKKLSEKIVENIIEGKIKPTARWRFWTSDIFYRTITVLALVLGGLSLGLSIFLLQNLDWGIYTFLGYSNLHSFVMGAFPYLFVLILLISLIGAYFFWRRTKKGYRIRLGTLTLLLLVFAGSFGFLSHIFGASQKIYLALESNPQTRMLVYARENQWMNPEKGLLWGGVEKASSQSFTLVDMDNNIWTVEYGNNFPSAEKLDESAVGQDVKVVGQKTGRNTFSAENISGWNGVMRCGCGAGNTVHGMMGEPETGNRLRGGMMGGSGGVCGSSPGGGFCGGVRE